MNPINHVPINPIYCYHYPTNPLKVAFQNEDAKEFGRLLESGATWEGMQQGILDEPDEGLEEFIPLLLKYGYLEWEMQNDPLGYSPLHNEARDGKVELFRFLHPYDVNLDLKTPFIKPPLWYAIIFNNLDSALTLIELGADFREMVDNRSLLSHAIERFYEQKAFQEVLALMQDALIAEDIYCINPDWIDEILKTLFESKALNSKCIDQLTDDRGVPFLHVAVSCEWVSLVKFLLENGCNPNVKTPTLITPLHIAVDKGSKPLVDLLLEAGADPQAIDWGKLKPFDLIRYTPDQCPIAVSLLKKGYDPRHNPNRAFINYREGGVSIFSQYLQFLDEEAIALRKEVLKRKLCGHAFEMGGDTSLYRREGKTSQGVTTLAALTHPHIVMKKMVKQLGYLQKYQPSYFPPEMVERISSICNAAARGILVSSEEYFTQITRGAPVILFTGFSSHSVVWIFLGDWLAICNRGSASKRGTPVEFYQINRQMVTLELIEAILNANHNQYEDYINLRQLAVEGLECSQGDSEKLLESMCPLKEQIVGNCTYASAEAALWTLFALQETPENLHKANIRFGLWQKCAKFLLTKSYFDYHLEDKSSFYPDLQLCRSLYEKIKEQSSPFLPELEKKYRQLTARFESIPPPASEPEKQETDVITYQILRQGYYKPKPLSLKVLGFPPRRKPETEPEDVPHSKKQRRGP